MQKRVLIYNDVPIVADDALSKGSIVIRDSSGNIAVAEVIATGLNITGTHIINSETVAATATMTGTSSCIFLDATAGAFTYTLLASATVPGTLLYLKKIDSSGNLPTVKGSGSEIIDAANTYTGLSSQYKTMLIRANGTGWDILSKT